MNACSNLRNPCIVGCPYRLRRTSETRVFLGNLTHSMKNKHSGSYKHVCNLRTRKRRRQKGSLTYRGTTTVTHYTYCCSPHCSADRYTHAWSTLSHTCNKKISYGKLMYFCILTSTMHQNRKQTDRQTQNTYIQIIKTLRLGYGVHYRRFDS